MTPFPLQTCRQASGNSSAFASADWFSASDSLRLVAFSLQSKGVLSLALIETAISWKLNRSLTGVPWAHWTCLIHMLFFLTCVYFSVVETQPKDNFFCPLIFILKWFFSAHKFRHQVSSTTLTDKVRQLVKSSRNQNASSFGLEPKVVNNSSHIPYTSKMISSGCRCAKTYACSTSTDSNIFTFLGYGNCSHGPHTGLLCWNIVAKTRWRVLIR